MAVVDGLRTGRGGISQRSHRKLLQQVTWASQWLSRTARAASAPCDRDEMQASLESSTGVLCQPSNKREASRRAAWDGLWPRREVTCLTHPRSLG